jgi:hypothetical protein
MFLNFPHRSHIVQFWGPRLAELGSSSLTWSNEPFIPSAYTHGTDTAYPPPSARRQAFKPSVLLFSWDPNLSSIEFLKAAKESAAHLKNVALADGQAVEHGIVYPNYGLSSTPLVEMYGENLPRLRALKKRVDPKNVMGLAGGFKL